MKEICPKCNKPKNHDDFYYRKGQPEWKAGKECKDCIAEIRKARRIGKTDFLYQFFN